MPDLLTGTVTFLFTDVERSTERLARSPDVYARSLDDQRRLVREAVADADGREIDCRGEEFFFAFARARDAVAAAAAAQSRLAGHDWPPDGRLAVRMGIHTGEPTVHDNGYLGLDVHEPPGSVRSPTADRYSSRRRRTTCSGSPHHRASH